MTILDALTDRLERAEALDGRGRIERVTASAFVDGSGDGVLVTAAGAGVRVVPGGIRARVLGGGGRRPELVEWCQVKWVSPASPR